MKNLIYNTVKLLGCTAFVAIAGIALGQQNQIRIKIEKNINGKQTTIDTTFSNPDDADAFMQQHNTGGNNEESFSFNFKSPSFNEIEKENIEKEFEELRQKLSENIEAFKFKFDTNEANGNYHFEFKMPGKDSWNEIEKELQEMNSKFKQGLDFDIDLNMPHCQSKENEISKLSEADRNTYQKLMEESEEKRQQALELLQKNKANDIDAPKTNEEKTIKKQRSVSGKKDAGAQDDAGNIRNVKVYPNPNKGLVKVSFEMAESGDVTIQITDEKGNTVLTETLPNFMGFYSNSFNLKRAQGTYTVAIVQGKNKVVQKIVIQ
ncbi:MAG: T9SS type A sorting domain-containing protein [Bacteroidia bacterium]|nr:T9SS type A sorting domain-containing protein [Bacteroidia bacterium]